jgi:hypothetical protein
MRWQPSGVLSLAKRHPILLDMIVQLDKGPDAKTVDIGHWASVGIQEGQVRFLQMAMLLHPMLLATSRSGVVHSPSDARWSGKISSLAAKEHL